MNKSYRIPNITEHFLSENKRLKKKKKKFLRLFRILPYDEDKIPFLTKIFNPFLSISLL